MINLLQEYAQEQELFPKYKRITNKIVLQSANPNQAKEQAFSNFGLLLLFCASHFSGSKILSFQKRTPPVYSPHHSASFGKHLENFCEIPSPFGRATPSLFLFFFVSRDKMPLSYKLDDKLEGVENFRAWKYRIGLILEENDLVKFIKDVPEPDAAETKEKFKKDMIRAKRIIANSIKDHLIPQVSSKETPK